MPPEKAPHCSSLRGTLARASCNSRCCNPNVLTACGDQCRPPSKLQTGARAGGASGGEARQFRTGVSAPRQPSPSVACRRWIASELVRVPRSLRFLLRHVSLLRQGKRSARLANSDVLLQFLHSTVVALVRRDEPDLSARQLAVFLTVYTRADDFTVRGLAKELNVAKPAITRALDRLEELDLARRRPELGDRRSITVARTRKGACYLAVLQQLLAGESS
jgi:DNA-binding MarR family transcriptional regulator